jgi:GT2 family glycosyltransferase
LTPTVDLSCIVVNYDQADLLRRCLTSLFETCGSLAIQVIVVDNGSSDMSLRMLQECFPGVEVISNDQNVGFAKANNQAIPLCSGKFVVLLNNDTVVLDHAFQSLVEFMEQYPRIGCAGPKLLNGDGSVQPSCLEFPSIIKAIPRFVGARFGRSVKYVPVKGNAWTYVEVVSGACMMLRREALEEVGLLDEGYFMYKEEVDWCYRASKIGWVTAYYPFSQVIHLGGQTARTEPVRFYVERRYSRVRFFYKHHGRLSARFVDGTVRLWIVVRWILATSPKREHYRSILKRYNQRIQDLFTQSVR